MAYVVETAYSLPYRIVDGPLSPTRTSFFSIILVPNYLDLFQDEILSRFAKNFISAGADDGHHYPYKFLAFYKPSESAFVTRRTEHVHLHIEKRWPSVGACPGRALKQFFRE